jgi:hypothetical protein
MHTYSGLELTEQEQRNTSSPKCIRQSIKLPNSSPHPKNFACGSLACPTVYTAWTATWTRSLHGLQHVQGVQLYINGLQPVQRTWQPIVLSDYIISSSMVLRSRLPPTYNLDTRGRWSWLTNTLQNRSVATILKSSAAHDEKDEICLFAKRPADPPDPETWL